MDADSRQRAAPLAGKSLAGRLPNAAHLREWARFEAEGSLGTVGTMVKPTTVGAPAPQVSKTTVTRSDAPKLLVYNRGAQDIRWGREVFGVGTRLTLGRNIDRRFISRGADGWPMVSVFWITFWSGTPIGRILGGQAMSTAAGNG